MYSQLFADVLMIDVWRRGKPDALLHHSDHGAHYGSALARRFVADNGFDRSMSRSRTV